jgi:hypothetical protein
MLTLCVLCRLQITSLVRSCIQYIAVNLVPLVEAAAQELLGLEAPLMLQLAQVGPRFAAVSVSWAARGAVCPCRSLIEPTHTAPCRSLNDKTMGLGTAAAAESAGTFAFVRTH